jgi:hypothetical protein
MLMLPELALVSLGNCLVMLPELALVSLGNCLVMLMWRASLEP